MKTIALIDQFPILRTGLEIFIKEQFADIETVEATSIVTFHDGFPDENPDFLILGISQIADSSNLSFIKMAKNWYPNAKIIVCDQRPITAMIPHYLKAGVYGYLTKQSTLAELGECITDVLRDKRYIANDILGLILETFPVEKIEAPKIPGNLTSKEYEIARYISQGMKTSLIAETLGKKMSTISTIKRNVYRKLSVDNVIALERLMSR